MWRFFFYSIYGNQFEVHKRPNMGPLTHSGLNGLQTTATTFLQKEPFCDPPVILLARLFSHVQEIASRRLPFPLALRLSFFINLFVDKNKMGLIYCKPFGE